MVNEFFKNYEDPERAEKVFAGYVDMYGWDSNLMNVLGQHRTSEKLDVALSLYRDEGIPRTRKDSSGRLMIPEGVNLIDRTSVVFEDPEQADEIADDVYLLADMHQSNRDLAVREGFLDNLARAYEEVDDSDLTFA